MVDIELSPSPPNYSKDSWKLLPSFVSINWPSLVTEWFIVQKIYSKMHPDSCTNIHHDVTDLVNLGLVENTKMWISWERNMTFLRNKKILNLCLRWHILRSYCFVAEVTFKNLLKFIRPNKLSWHSTVSNFGKRVWKIHNFYHSAN